MEFRIAATWGRPERPAYVLVGSVSLGESPAALLAVDLDGDTNLDLASVNQGSGDVSVVLNVDHLSYTTSRYPAVESPDRIVAGDLNGDGLPELVVASSVETRVAVLWNAGGGDFTRSDDLLLGDGKAVGLRMEDFDSDGDLDLAVARLAPCCVFGADTIEIVSGDGAGALEHSATVPLAAVRIELLFSGELDGNPGPDLALLTASGGSIRVLGNRGDGTFETPTRSRMSLQHHGANRFYRRGSGSGRGSRRRFAAVQRRRSHGDSQSGGWPLRDGPGLRVPSEPPPPSGYSRVWSRSISMAMASPT